VRSTHLNEFVVPLLGVGRSLGLHRFLRALETSAGTAGLEKPDLEKAKTLLTESGYDGRTRHLHAAERSQRQLQCHGRGRRGDAQGGLQVEIQPLDWGTLSQRRNNKGPVDKGGWNLFITVATALDASTPLTNPYLATPCPNDVAGFPCDEELQRLRRSWWESTDEAERARLNPSTQDFSRSCRSYSLPR
jgi:peptide/nickel transport system substrate-binding protein